jgi:pantothenate synthetase
VTLKPPAANKSRALRVLGAAWLGKTRLIDNVGVEPGGS